MRDMAYLTCLELYRRLWWIMLNSSSIPPLLAPEAMPLQEGDLITESTYVAVVLLRDR
jgi:hypothetical protein